MLFVPLPFLVAPAPPRKRSCGNADSGILQLPELGGLTVLEASVVDELLAGRPNAFVEAAKVADAISANESITRIEGFAIIEQAVGGSDMEQEAQNLRLKYASQINTVIAVFSSSSDYTKEAAVTALIRCRLSLPDWSLTDTRGLHRRLLNEIYDLYLEEIAAEETPSAQLSEEDIKKPPLASGKQRKRTTTPLPTNCSITSPANTTAPALEANSAAT